MASRFCRDCLHAQVIGRDVLGELTCRCERGHWGPVSWGCGLVAPSCSDFQPAAEQPGSLRFWGLQPGHGLEPEPRRRQQSAPPGGRGARKENSKDGRAEHSQGLRGAA